VRDLPYLSIADVEEAVAGHYSHVAPNALTSTPTTKHLTSPPTTNQPGPSRRSSTLTEPYNTKTAAPPLRAVPPLSTKHQRYSKPPSRAAVQLTPIERPEQTLREPTTATGNRGGPGGSAPRVDIAAEESRPRPTNTLLRSWRWRESNPRPSVPRQGFSERSLLCFSQPRQSRRRVADGLSHCLFSLTSPWPGR